MEMKDKKKKKKKNIYIYIYIYRKEFYFCGFYQCVYKLTAKNSQTVRVTPEEGFKGFMVNL